MYRDVLAVLHVMATCIIMFLAIQLKEILLRTLLQ
jgi:hypothetical protein